MTVNREINYSLPKISNLSSAFHHVKYAVMCTTGTSLCNSSSVISAVCVSVVAVHILNHVFDSKLKQYQVLSLLLTTHQLQAKKTILCIFCSFGCGVL